MSQENSNKSSALVPMGALICFGLIIMGLFIYWGLQSFSNKERVVTVRGLAEQKIMATQSNFTLSTTYTSDEVGSAIKATEKQITEINSYLVRKGYQKIKVNPISIYDNKDYHEWVWRGSEQVKERRDRYRVTQTIEFQFENVEIAEEKLKEIEFDFATTGVNSYVSCKYIFPELNDIKPELIAESTRNARITGEQFAKDSQSKLGKIKTASQGQIAMSGDYSSSDGYIPFTEKPYINNVRVVSTIVFFLED